MSSSVLRQRPVEVEDAALVERTADDRNRLTQLGHDLGDAIDSLTAWARRWQRSPDG